MTKEEKPRYEYFTHDLKGETAHEMVAELNEWGREGVRAMQILPMSTSAYYGRTETKLVAIMERITNWDGGRDDVLVGNNS